jgi:hypothetical protein
MSALSTHQEIHTQGINPPFLSKIQFHFANRNDGMKYKISTCTSSRKIIECTPPPLHDTEATTSFQMIIVPFEVERQSLLSLLSMVGCLSTVFVVISAWVFVLDSTHKGIIIGELRRALIAGLFDRFHTHHKSVC